MMMRLGLLFLALVPLIGASVCKLQPVRPGAEIPRLETKVCNMQNTLLKIQNMTEVNTKENTDLEQKMDKLMSNLSELRQNMEKKITCWAGNCYPIHNVKSCNKVIITSEGHFQ